MEYAANASKLHKTFGQALLDAGYGGFSIQQEVAVKQLCPDYSNGRDRFDYYIRELNVVVELHGEQHYKPTTFGGVSQNTATNNYISRVRADERKFLAAVTHGYYYVSFRYDEDVTIDEFHQKLEAARKITEEHEINIEEKPKEKNEFKEKARQQAREYRKKLYQENKERSRAWRLKQRKEYEQK